ncbi:MAG: amidohydrolase family protein [Balneolaceae bacterium]
MTLSKSKRYSISEQTYVCLRRAFLLTALILFHSGTADLRAQITGKPAYGDFAITNATVHTVTNGIIEGGVVLVEEGEITHVGSNVRVPDSVHRIDATGLHLYPGFIDSFTHLGLVEISAVPVTVDHRELGTHNPQVQAVTAINPHAVAIPVTRVGGVTTVISSPASSQVAGKAALIDLWGYTPEAMAVTERAALVVEWPSLPADTSNEDAMERYESQRDELDDYWQDAQFYESMISAYNQGEATTSRPERNLRLEAMREVVRGEIPVILRVNRERDILKALEWISNYPEISFLFQGVAEGWRVASRIAEAEVPVIVNTLYTPLRSYDNYQRPYQNPGLLAEAGVLVLLGTGETENVRNLLFEAGYAAAYGLGREEALKSITINPARAWGVEDRFGSIEPGKQANLVLTDGDPFEPSTHIHNVMINGYLIPMESRQQQLFEEFLDWDATR